MNQTIQLIVDILCFDMDSSQILKHKFENSGVDWDAIVAVASEHLVLPAVYCRLQQKSLLKYLPDDLVVYLEALTDLNRARNATLTTECQALSQIFNTHQIEYVFIKGTALLLGNYYTDIGERMIGDIDLLIAPEHLDRAFDLLVTEGYSEFITFNYEVKNYRHRPRQISKHHLGAVELHSELLKYSHNHLIDTPSFFSTKMYVNDAYIPDANNLIRNTILAAQVNNSNFYLETLNLKALYDVMVLKLDEKPEMITEISTEKHGLGFLSLASIFLPSLAPSLKSNWSKRHQNKFLFSLKFRKFGRFFYRLKLLNLNTQERLTLFICNKSYRRHIFQNKLFK